MISLKERSARRYTASYIYMTVLIVIYSIHLYMCIWVMWSIARNATKMREFRDIWWALASRSHILFFAILLLPQDESQRTAVHNSKLTGYFHTIANSGDALQKPKRLRENFVEKVLIDRTYSNDIILVVDVRVTRVGGGESTSFHHFIKYPGFYYCFILAIVHDHSLRLHGSVRCHAFTQRGRCHKPSERRIAVSVR